MLCSHSVVGYYADHELAVSRIDREDGGLLLLRAGAVVMATGCIEQPAVFRNNDLPGVLLGSAAQRLLYRHGISVGERIVVLGANDDAMALALDLLSQGLKVTDLAVPEGSPIDAACCRWRAARAGIRVHLQVREIAAQAGSDGALAAVEWMPVAREHRLRLPADVHGLDAGIAARAAGRREHRVRRALASTCRRHCRRDVRRRSRQWLLCICGARGRWRSRGSAAARMPWERADVLRPAPTLSPRPHFATRIAIRIPRRCSRIRTARNSSISTRTSRCGSCQCRAGRLRQHRTAEALQHGGHGPVAGQALEPQCRAASGARDRARLPIAGPDHRATACQPVALAHWPARGLHRCAHSDGCLA